MDSVFTRVHESCPASGAGRGPAANRSLRLIVIFLACLVWMTPTRAALVNGGAEAGDTSGWTVSGGNVAATTGNATYIPVEGSYLFTFSFTAAGSGWMTQTGTGDVGEGTVLRLSGYLSTDNTDSGTATLTVYDGVGGVLDSASVGPQTTNVTWQPFLLALTVPAGAASWEVRLDGQRGVPGSVTDVNWDALVLIADNDDDGIENSADNCPDDANPGQENNDGDSAGDVCDDDDDNDGVPDVDDAFPFDAAESADTDRDGIGNNADSDDDNDTIPDFLDQPPGRDPLVADWRVSVGSFHTCVLDDSGVVCWGRADNGAISVPPLSGPVSLTVGGEHGCVQEDDIDIVCWGRNDFGQRDVPSLSNPYAVDAGYLHTCALDDTGAVCWGNDDEGQGSSPALVNPSAVDAGQYYHSCALDDTGVVCWGNDAAGQISTIPALSNPVAVSAGAEHTCARDDTGVVCWGYNGQGQTAVPALSNPLAVAAGWYYTCAVDGGNVVCWGDNADGQSSVPPLSHPVAVDAGSSHTCALDDTGVVCWGLDNYGQSTVPVLSFDKDRDGLIDSVEDANGNGFVDPGETDPLDPDSDRDGLSDGEEDANGNGMLDAGESDPQNVDSDGDGLTDGYEVNVAGTDPLSTTPLCAADPCDLNASGGTDAGDLILLRKLLLEE